MSATKVETPAQEEAKGPEVKSEPTTDVVSEADPKTTTTGEAAAAEPKSEVPATDEASAGGDDKTNGDKPTEADAKKEDDKSRFRLLGAARNRFRFLVRNGIDRDRAAELAKDPNSIKELRENGELNANGKRPNSNGTSGGPANKQVKTVTGPIRMVVVTENHPVTTLTSQQANTIKSAILKQVVLQKDSPLKPHFEDCTLVTGYLLLQCSDRPTVEWLEGVVPKLELWEGASVKVATEKSLLRSDIYIAVFGDSIQDENKDILSFVESQNDGVETSKWHIMGRKENKPKKEVELTLTMDNASGKLLSQKNFSLNYKFAKVNFQRKKKIVAAPGSNVGQARNGNNPRRANGPPMNNQRRSSSFVPIWDNNLPHFGNNNSRFNNGGGRDFNRGGNFNRPSGGYPNRPGGPNPNRSGGGVGNRYANSSMYSGDSRQDEQDRHEELLTQLMRTVNRNQPRRGNNAFNLNGGGGGGGGRAPGRPNNNNRNRNVSRAGFF